jgi:hypothetical protein
MMNLLAAAAAAAAVGNISAVNTDVVSAPLAAAAVASDDGAGGLATAERDDEAGGGATAAAAAAQWWGGVAGGARYSVLLTPWHAAPPGTAPYSISFSEETWLRGTIPTVHCSNRWHTASDGSLSWLGAKVTNGTDEEWGPFSAANITWSLQHPNTSTDSGTASSNLFYTSVIHYARADVPTTSSTPGDAVSSGMTAI